VLKRVLGIDVETTGLDCSVDRITEVGAVLYDMEEKKPLYMVNFNCTFKSSPPLTEEIIQLTGITPELLAEFSVEDNRTAFINLRELMLKADAVAAHNAPFDRGFIEATFKGLGIDVPQVFWADTSVDIPYPPAIKTRKLVHLAAEHGFLNPFAHRALFDVLTMLRIMGQYDMETVKLYAESPNVRLVADTLPPWQDMAPEGEKQVDKAKARGYRWDGADKVWAKLVKDFQADAERKACKDDFKVRIVQCAN